MSVLEVKLTSIRRRPFEAVGGFRRKARLYGSYTVKRVCHSRPAGNVFSAGWCPYKLPPFALWLSTHSDFRRAQDVLAQRGLAGHFPVSMSLGVIVAILALSIGLSLVFRASRAPKDPLTNRPDR